MNPLGAMQRFAIAALAVIIIGGAFGGWMHHKGYAAGQSANLATIASLTAANVKQADAIKQLQDVNDAFAQAAKVSQADQERAKAAMVRQHEADLAALKANEKRLNDALHANQDAAAWGRARVPASVVRVLAGPG